jgi:von Willebrand factor type A domain.
MWGQVDKVPKITTAKQVLSNLVQNLPADINVGLMTYGHRSEKDCKDVETLIAIAPNDPKKFSSQVQNLKPKGMTPLTYSLEQSLPLFASFKGQENSVVLVSDGKETCDGDPCEGAKKLAAAGVNLKVHVVGFDVSAEERKQLECIAKEGKGRYFDAQNAKGFQEAIVQVKDVVAKPPEKKKTELYFSDDFDGDILKEHWEVINPNTDNFIVENGKLLVVNSSDIKPSDKNMENLFRLTTPLPEGDWVMSAKVTVNFQTKQERIFLGTYENPDNFILVLTEECSDRGSSAAYCHVGVIKNSQGKSVPSRKRFWESNIQGPFSESIKALPQPLLLRIRKEGTSYIGGIMMEANKEPKWIELDKLTLLRPKGNLVIGLYQNYAGEGGETPVCFDWVKVEKLK